MMNFRIFAMRQYKELGIKAADASAETKKEIRAKYDAYVAEEEAKAAVAETDADASAETDADASAETDADASAETDADADASAETDADASAETDAGKKKQKKQDKPVEPVEGKSIGQPLTECLDLFQKLMDAGMRVNRCGAYCSARHIVQVHNGKKYVNAFLFHTGKKAPRIQIKGSYLPEKLEGFGIHVIGGYALDHVVDGLTYDNVWNFLCQCFPELAETDADASAETDADASAETDADASAETDADASAETEEE